MSLACILAGGTGTFDGVQVLVIQPPRTSSKSDLGIIIQPKNDMNLNILMIHLASDAILRLEISLMPEILAFRLSLAAKKV